MSHCGRQRPIRHRTAFAAVLIALFAGPAHAFFRPVPVATHTPTTNKPPIHVPVQPPPNTGGGGGTTHTGGGSTPPVDSAPEPNGLLLALLGGGGLGLFAACRRRTTSGNDRGRRESAAPAISPLCSRVSGSSSAPFDLASAG